MRARVEKVDVLVWNKSVLTRLGRDVGRDMMWCMELIIQPIIFLCVVHAESQQCRLLVLLGSWWTPSEFLLGRNTRSVQWKRCRWYWEQILVLPCTRAQKYSMYKSTYWRRKRKAGFLGRERKRSEILRLGQPVRISLSGAGRMFATALRRCGQADGAAGQEKLIILITVSIAQKKSWVYLTYPIVRDVWDSMRCSGS